MLVLCMNQKGDNDMIYGILFIFCLIAQSVSFAIDAPPPAQEPDKETCPELSGHVILPKNTDYQKARLVSNYYVSKNSYPNVIVYCQNTQDVKNAVRWARCHKMPVRVRSGGHNHEGFSTGSGAIVIDVSKMKKIFISPSGNFVSVEPGNTGGELYATLFRHGLTQVGGTCGRCRRVRIGADWRLGPADSPARACLR